MLPDKGPPGVEGNLYAPISIESTSEVEPLIAIDHLDEKHLRAGTSGIAAALGARGTATVTRYGMAYSQRAGVANGQASGVSLTKNNGSSQSGDGGVSVAHHYGDASCGHLGIAYSQNPGPRSLGAVSGGIEATLVIGWVNAEMSYSKTVRVGDCVDGITIEVGHWYTLDPDNDYRWVERISEGQ